MTGSTDELPEPGTRRLLIIPHQLRGRPRGQLHDKPAAYSELMLPTMSYQAPQQLIALDPKALSALPEDEARGSSKGWAGCSRLCKMASCRQISAVAACADG